MEKQTVYKPNLAKRVFLFVAVAALCLCVVGALTVAYRIFVESNVPH